MGGDSPDTSGQNEAARLNAQIAREVWDQYKTTYLPMENQYVKDAQNYDTPEKRETAAREASADTEQQYAQQKQANERSMAGMGISPDDQKFQAINMKLMRDQAATGAGAQNAARRGVEQEGWARRTGALSLGKGLPAQASGASTAAGQGFGQINSQNQTYNQNQATNVSNAATGVYDIGHAVGGWADGGYVTGIKKLARGGPAGPAGMDQILANLQASSQTPTGPTGPTPEQQAVEGAKWAKRGYDIYNKFNPSTTGANGAGLEGSQASVDVGMDALGGGESLAPATTEAATIGTTDAATTGALGAGAGEAAAGTTAAATEAAAAAAAQAAAATAATTAAGAGAMTAAEAAPLLLMLLANGGRVNGTTGGKVDGPGTETSDGIPAMLSDGEYVLNADAVRHFGISKLDKMNEIGLQKRYGINKRRSA